MAELNLVDEPIDITIPIFIKKYEKTVSCRYITNHFYGEDGKIFTAKYELLKKIYDPGPFVYRLVEYKERNNG